MALVAFVSFSSAAAGVESQMVHIVNLLSSFVKVEDATIQKLLDNNQVSLVDRQDPKMAYLVKLLEKISKINWKDVDKYITVNKFTFDRTLTVDGVKVAMPRMFELLESVSKIHWGSFARLFCKSNSFFSFFLLSIPVLILIIFSELTYTVTTYNTN